MKAIAILTVGLIVSPVLYAEAEMFKDYYRSQHEDYDEYRVRGYNIQPPVPPSWRYEGCREGDYDCMNHFIYVKPYHHRPTPDLIRDIQ